MKLTELSIQGFGKLYQKTFSFQDGIHVLYGPNEAGKSTLHTFIGCMLFGLERRRGRAAQNDLYSRYLPWEHDAAYGGSLSFEYDDESFLLERSFRQGHKSCFLTTPGQGRIACPQELLAEKYYDGLTEELYYNTISIRQAGSAAGHSLAGEVQKHLVGVYQTGSDTLDYDRAISWLKAEKKRLETGLDSSPEERYFLLKQKKEQMAGNPSPSRLCGEKKALEQEMDLCMNALLERTEQEDIREPENPDVSPPSLSSGFLSFLRLLPGLACLLFAVLLWLNHNSAAAIACGGAAMLLLIAGRRRRRTEEPEGEDGSDRDEEPDEYGDPDRDGEPEEYDDLDKDGEPEEYDGMDKDGEPEEYDGMDRDEEPDEYDDLDEDEEPDEYSALNRDGESDEYNNPNTDREWGGSEGSDQDRNFNGFGASDTKKTLEGYPIRSMTVRQLRLRLATLQKRYQEVCRSEWEADRSAEQVRVMEEELEALAQKMEEQKKIRLEVQAVTLAMDLLKKAAGEIQNTVGPHLNESMSQILSGLTGGRYRQVYVDDQLCVTVRTGNRTVPLDSLSRGTVEQIHLALRLAVIDLLFPAGGMPLLLDDCFLAYDDERLRQTLGYLAENYSGQIFLFTCQKREAAILKSEKIPFSAVLLPPEAAASERL